MSQAGASLLLIVVLMGLAVFLLVSPPPGFDSTIVYRLVLPFTLVATGLGVLENLRTRNHMSQLIGAIRAQAGKSGATPPPEVVREAIEILLQALEGGEGPVRETAARELRKMTGQQFGPDPDAWREWWAENRASFGKRGT